MDYAHIVDPLHYSVELGRFIDLGFKPTSDDGAISAIETQCARLRSGGVCQHIASQSEYRSLVPDDRKPVYWLVPVEELRSEGATFRTDGIPEPCHWLIEGLAEKKAKKFFKKWQQANGLERFFVCDSETPCDRDTLVAVKAVAERQAGLTP